VTICRRFFGNPQLGVSHGRHTCLGGVISSCATTFRSSKVVFYSHSTDLAVRQRLGDAQTGPSPGSGRSGAARTVVQLLLRKELSAKFFGWISYTLMRSERLDHPGGEYRLFDYDQTHVGAIVGLVRSGQGPFELGARLRYSTGYPKYAGGGGALLQRTT